MLCVVSTTARSLRAARITFHSSFLEAGSRPAGGSQRSSWPTMLLQGPGAGPGAAQEAFPPSHPQITKCMMPRLSRCARRSKVWPFCWCKAEQDAARQEKAAENGGAWAVSSRASAAAPAQPGGATDLWTAHPGRPPGKGQLRRQVKRFQTYWREEWRRRETVQQGQPGRCGPRSTLQPSMPPVCRHCAAGTQQRGPRCTRPERSLRLCRTFHLDQGARCEKQHTGQQAVPTPTCGSPTKEMATLSRRFMPPLRHEGPAGLSVRGGVRPCWHAGNQQARAPALHDTRVAHLHSTHSKGEDSCIWTALQRGLLAARTACDLCSGAAHCPHL